MSRNYQKENEWQKNKYTSITVRLEKELGKNLKEKLKREEKTATAWITECAKNYLKKD